MHIVEYSLFCISSDCTSLIPLHHLKFKNMLNKSSISVIIGVLTGILVGFVIGFAYGTPGVEAAAGRSHGNVSELSRHRHADIENGCPDQGEEASAAADTVRYRAVDADGVAWDITMVKR